MKKLKSIMLIDDNADDNFFHERVIKKCQAAERVIIEQSAEAALDFLQLNEQNPPDLIFLDINMPGMNGWEFLNEYAKLKKNQQRPVVIMLTTSENPDDLAKAASITYDLRSKPLTKEILEEVIGKYF